MAVSRTIVFKKDLGHSQNTVNILEKFDKTFPTSPSDSLGVFAEEPLEETAALLSMAGGFWPNHANACRKAGIKPLFSPYEGHMPICMWTKAFESKGLKALEMKSLLEHNPVNTVFVFQKP